VVTRTSSPSPIISAECNRFIVSGVHGIVATDHV
jgi:hypothetical protein